MCETFMNSPIADTGKSSSREEVAQERVVFNRKLLLNGTNPVGGQKEAKGLWETRLRDLVTARQDGAAEIKNIVTLERELRSRDSARLALKALDAVPQEWKAVLTPDARGEGVVSGVQNSWGLQGAGWDVMGQRGAARGRVGCHEAEGGCKGQSGTTWGRGGLQGAEWDNMGQRGVSRGRVGCHGAEGGCKGQGGMSWGRGGLQGAEWDNMGQRGVARGRVGCHGAEGGCKGQGGMSWGRGGLQGAGWDVMGQRGVARGKVGCHGAEGGCKEQSGTTWDKGG
ncbi:unnamed protein product [Closterium sp. NIES-65]|nr:unnamed protein product [Closterium sp. NIES-65]